MRSVSFRVHVDSYKAFLLAQGIHLEIKFRTWATKITYVFWFTENLSEPRVNSCWHTILCCRRKCFIDDKSLLMTAGGLRRLLFI